MQGYWNPLSRPSSAPTLLLSLVDPSDDFNKSYSCLQIVDEEEEQREKELKAKETAAAAPQPSPAEAHKK